MISVGITGSYAVGKSLILNYLSQRDYKTFIADEIVSKFYQHNDRKKQVLQFIPYSKEYNKNLITKLFFEDSTFRKKVTKLVHPYVEKELKAFINKNANEEVVFSEIPMLFEASFEKYFDYIVTIYCSEKTRLIRAKNKPNFTFKKFRQIKKHQLSQFEKIKRADLTINTDINLLKLNGKITQLIQKIKC